MTKKFNLGKTGVVGRFRPINNLGKNILVSLCENSEELIIGIGSSNKYDSRNPFSAKESEEMLRLVLKGHQNYGIIHIPDSGHLPEYRDGKKWTLDAKAAFGELDFFVTGNQYVTQLMSPHYRILHPFALFNPEERVRIRSSEVRKRMVLGEDWQSLVPQAAVDYLEKNNLIERMKREFGEQILADARIGESYEEEKLKTHKLTQ